MLSFPRLEINQGFAKIGIKTTPYQFNMKQPRGEQYIKQEPAILNIHQPKGELTIDSSRALDAVGLGGTLKVSKRLADQGYMLGIQAIGEIARKGDRLAAIHLNQNQISQMASESFFDNLRLDICGPANFDNVDLNYQARRPEIDIKARGATHHYVPHKPEISFMPGKVNTYVRQKNFIDIEFHYIDQML